MITFGDGATAYYRGILTDLIHRGYVVEVHGAPGGPWTPCSSAGWRTATTS